MGLIMVESFGYFYRICMHTHLCMCVYMQSNLYVCAHTCIYTCIFMCASPYKTKTRIGSHCFLLAVQAQRRSREHSRSASALSLSGGDEKSEPSDGVDQHLSYYSNEGFFATSATGTRRKMPFIHVWGQMVCRRAGRAVLVMGSCSVIPFARRKHWSTPAKCWVMDITNKQM